MVIITSIQTMLILLIVIASILDIDDGSYKVEILAVLLQRMIVIARIRHLDPPE